MSFERRLADEWMFDEVDLEANNAGRLSDAQRQGFARIARDNRRRSRRSAITVAVVFGLAGIGVAAAIASPAGGGGGTTAGAVALVLFAWMGLIVAWAAGRNRRTRTMFEQANLRTLESELRAVNPTSSGTWTAVFGPVKFELDGIRAGVLCAGRTYRVHYLESGRERLLITLEPIDRAAG